MNAPAENAMARSLEQGFQLGTLRIDPRTGEAVGPGGREKLDPKVMGVLKMLAQHAGQIVPREDLMARLWPSVIVTDEVLSRCIYELRRQLTQAGGNERYKEMIETLPKRGYRLRGEITPYPSPAGARTKWRWAAAAIAAGIALLLAIFVSQRIGEAPAEHPPSPVAAASNSIAVLPFVDMSASKDQGYLADGISEEILNRLAKAENLRVIARTSSFSYRNRPLEIAEIAKQLDVTHVLEGSVRKSGEQIRVTAQLIAASNDSHVWSDTYDRGLGDIFAVQDEIAAAVATALDIALSRGAHVAQAPANFAAYEKFAQGEFFYYRRARGDIERATKYYEEAVATDPRFARAWAALSGAYSFLVSETDPPREEILAKQGQAALRAVELDPNLAQAQVRLAEYYAVIQEYEKYDVHHRKAVALDPDGPVALGHKAEKAVDRGDLATATAVHRRLVAENPLSSVARNNLAVVLFADGQLDEALSQFRKVQEVHPDTEPHVSIDILHIFILQRRFEQAQSEIAYVPEGKLRDQALALLYEATDRQAEADAALRRLTARPGDTMDTIRLAEIYAYRGMHEEAFDALQGRKAALKGPGYVWHLQHESRLSPFLKVLHSDARWSDLIAPVN